MKRNTLARKALAVLAALAMLLAAMTACGGSGGSTSGGSTSSSSSTMTSNSTYSYSAEDAGYGGETFYESPEYEEDASEQPLKMIYTASLELESTAFEETAAAISKLVERLGGYFADSTIGNRGSGYRWASYTVRMPVENFWEFLNQTGELCHETRRSTNQEDVSEFYYDTAGRLRTQQIKLERLQALLERAENMEDIITIESAISETEQTIEGLSGTLRHYDNLVDYSTIDISLSEVYRFSNVEEVPVSFAQRLSASFQEGLGDFTDWLEDLAVGLAYCWLWLVILAAVIFVAVKLLQRSARKRREAVFGETQSAPGMVRSPLTSKKNADGSTQNSAESGAQNNGCKEDTE